VDILRISVQGLCTFCSRLCLEIWTKFGFSKTEVTPYPLPSFSGCLLGSICLDFSYLRPFCVKTVNWKIIYYISINFVSLFFFVIL